MVWNILLPVPLYLSKFWNFFTLCDLQQFAILTSFILFRCLWYVGFSMTHRPDYLILLHDRKSSAVPHLMIWYHKSSYQITDETAFSIPKFFGLLLFSCLRASHHEGCVGTSCISNMLFGEISQTSQAWDKKDLGALTHRFELSGFSKQSFGIEAKGIKMFVYE